MAIKITLKQLNVFVNTAKNGSLTKAAETCFITQAAASMSLLELERLLGLPLFDRIGKRLKINVNGKILLPKAIATLDRIEEIQSLTEKEGEQLRGILTIGASSTIGNHVLPDYIAKFKKDYPSVYIQLIISNSDEIMTRLKALDLDFGLIERDCNDEDIIKTPWMEDELQVICHANHLLSKKKQLSIDELSQYPWVMREHGSGTRDIIINAIPDQFDMKIEATFNSSEAIKNYLRCNSNCLACLSKAIVSTDIQAKLLKPLKIKGVKLSRFFYKILNKNKYQSNIAQLFQNSITL